MKLTYLVNNEIVRRSDFYEQLRSSCVQNKRQMILKGYGQISPIFDSTLFNSVRKNLLSGDDITVDNGDEAVKYKISRLHTN